VLACHRLLAVGKHVNKGIELNYYYYYYYYCPSAGCAYAANAVGTDLDIFAIGAISLNHVYTRQPKIINVFIILMFVIRK
jgi:hypothetical protein